MVRHTETLKVGDSEIDPDVKLGPVQNAPQYRKVKEYFDDCAANGYTFATGGSWSGGKGYFIAPTIVDDPPSMSVCISLRLQCSDLVQFSYCARGAVW
jgi:acyl-CoA reductase-like NAD-dependent aldehyde dehydrogenase